MTSVGLLKNVDPNALAEQFSIAANQLAGEMQGVSDAVSSFLNSSNLPPEDLQKRVQAEWNKVPQICERLGKIIKIQSLAKERVANYTEETRKVQNALRALSDSYNCLNGMSYAIHQAFFNGKIAAWPQNCKHASFAQRFDQHAPWIIPGITAGIALLAFSDTGSSLVASCARIAISILKGPLSRFAVGTGAICATGYSLYSLVPNQQWVVQTRHSLFDKVHRWINFAVDRKDVTFCTAAATTYFITAPIFSGWMQGGIVQAALNFGAGFAGVEAARRLKVMLDERSIRYFMEELQLSPNGQPIVNRIQPLVMQPQVGNNATPPAEQRQPIRQSQYARAPRQPRFAQDQQHSNFSWVPPRGNAAAGN